MTGKTSAGKTKSMDWFYKFSYPIGGEQLATEGLRKRGNAIEKIVAPHVTTKKTPNAIRFRGTRRYVKRIETDEVRRKVWYAIEVLQGIYHLLDAWREGNINDVVRLAYSIGWLDSELVKSEFFGFPLYTEVNAKFQARRRGTGKKGKTKLKPDVDGKLLRVRRKHFGHGRHWFQDMKNELREEWGIEISESTLRRRFREILPQTAD